MFPFIVIASLILSVSSCANRDNSTQHYEVMEVPGTLVPDSLANPDTAIFAGGCFWCTEAQYDLLRGVDTVISGYTDGHVKNPTYRQVTSGTTGHAEAVMVIFDPDEISYETLLEVFFTGHDPTQLNRQGNDIGTQYRSAIFVRSDHQWEKAAYYIKKLNEEVFDQKIVTQLKPFSAFYPAEDYHQKYVDNNVEDRYCQFVILPKLDKIRATFAEKLK